MAVVKISFVEKCNDAESISCNGDVGFLFTGEHDGKNVLRSFDGDTDVNSKSNEFTGDDTLTWVPELNEGLNDVRLLPNSTLFDEETS